MVVAPPPFLSLHFQDDLDTPSSQVTEMQTRLDIRVKNINTHSHQTTTLIHHARNRISTQKRSNKMPFYDLTSLKALAAGSIFGGAITAAGVYHPSVIIGQMKLEDFHMLKVFLTATATSA